ncbi:Tricarboxylate/iron carrier [Umbelopsis sp. PMI_123]|nr:Tricarboxylate/iron carrier [Umbelopsis sp. PMI_123]
MESKESPVIDLTRSHYDLSTYFGRIRHFVEITDPRTLLVSPSGVKKAQALIEDYNAGKVKGVESAQLWKAKQIVDSTIHPDTGEPVLLPFRMSAFVPTNLIVVAGMLMPNPTIKSILFWQWCNQSLNVAVNYSNSNKTTPMSLQETAVAYVSAVSTSCLIAVGLTQSVPKLKIAPSTKSLLMKLVPFTAVAAAGTVNVFLMRGKEIREGIDVYDEHGNSVGKSKVAGLTAVSQVAISRVLTNAPVLVIPPLLMGRLQKTEFLKARPGLTAPINLGLIGLSLMTALPAAIAVFPQRGSLKAENMEEEFRNIRDKDGKKLNTLFYNKGL